VGGALGYSDNRLSATCVTRRRSVPHGQLPVADAQQDTGPEGEGIGGWDSEPEGVSDAVYRVEEGCYVDSVADRRIAHPGTA
jgi:hypothetical protein